MDQQPKIPTLKDSQKPQVKVRGLEAGVTLFDRLKQFKKKDLAFILAGMGTLFMAPLAEHFMMSPESGDAAMSPGFGKGGAGNGGGIFGSGGSVGYDNVTGTAPGGAIGGGSDVITPLNVRDPSALVMGPGATQQPPTNSVAPATPPPTAPTTHSDSDLKDALAASARGVGAAAHAAKSLLPVPKVSLSNSGLRGLGAVSGGSTATGSSGISSNGLAPNRAADSQSLGNVRSAPGYKGVARGQTSGGGGLEALKNAASNAGEQMNRGSAATALDKTAAEAIPAGGGFGGGAGGGGHDGADKAFGGNQGKDSKSTGESLEFMKQKAIQEANIARWAKEQEAGDNKLELLKIRNKAAETFADTMVKGASEKMAACLFKGFKNPACAGTASDPGQYLCSSSQGGKRDMSIGGDKVGDCTGDEPDWLAGNGNIYACNVTGSGDSTSKSKAQGTPVAFDCISDGAKNSGSPSADDPNKPGSVGRADTPGSGANDALIRDAVNICNKIDKNSTAQTVDGVEIKPDAEVVTYLSQLKVAARDMVVARDAAYSGASADCKGTGGQESLKAKSGADLATDQIKAGVASLGGTNAPNGKAIDDSAIGKMKAVVTKDDAPLTAVPGSEEYKKAQAAYEAANDLMTQAKAQLAAYDTAMKAAKWTPGKDPALEKSLADLRTSLDNIRAGVDGKLTTVSGALDKLKAQLDEVSKAGAPLQNVVANNVDYKKEMGNSPAADAKAPAVIDKASDLGKVLDKVNQHNEKAGGKPIEYTLPDVKEPDAKTGTAEATTKSITDTKTSLGDLKKALTTLDGSVAAKDGPFLPTDEPIKTASDAADSASTNKAAMQANQRNWLDNIYNGLPSASSLPTK